MAHATRQPLRAEGAFPNDCAPPAFVKPVVLTTRGRHPAAIQRALHRAAGLTRSGIHRLIRTMKQNGMRWTGASNPL